MVPCLTVLIFLHRYLVTKGNASIMLKGVKLATVMVRYPTMTFMTPGRFSCLIMMSSYVLALLFYDKSLIILWVN